MITYRQPIALDIPVLATYEKELFPYSPWSTSQFKEEFAGIPATRFISVAEDENTIVGYCGVFVPAPGIEADILTVAVLPAYRRRGIAKEFMRQIEAYAVEREASAIMLEVELSNESAIKLYESLGYMKISVRMDYYGPGKDAHVMRKGLS
ncbi:RimI Acetyltransferases [Candidatus Nanopelagicaceae bacterium]